MADLERMKTRVAAADHPWIEGWNLFITDPKAQSTWRDAARPDTPSRQRAQDDATAMYYNALRWYISGDASYGDCAVRIANAWSGAVNQRPGGDYLSAIPVGSFALAAELLRLYPGWLQPDQAKFKSMLADDWYPKCDEFLRTHGGAPDSRYWTNWDTCNMLAVLSIGVFCDDRAKYDQAIEYFRNGKGTGSIGHAVPFLYPGGLGQWQESGRDQAHAMVGTGQMAEFCQVAWNQGLDLFGYDDNRLLKGAEYTAQYTLWKGVPYTFYNNADNARQPYISQNYHGRLDASHFELLYNHYAVRQGLKAPNVKLLAELKRPEPGNVDIFGYGTLTFTLDAQASPYPASPVPPVPLDLTATPGIGRVDLKWSPSGAYSTQGYEVMRAEVAAGPYASIYSVTNWTTPLYTDTGVEAGKTYYYTVAAINQAGRSAASSPVDATPASGRELPAGWSPAAEGQTLYSGAANGSFTLTAAGTGLGGQSDHSNFASRAIKGDFALTARLIDRRGPVNLTGLMVRESIDENARMVALTLGEVGGRQARFRTRSQAGTGASTQLGNDYTWIPAWFRLQRVGDVFTALQSSDGIEWFEAGKSSVALPATVLVGLAAGSGGAKDIGAVTFDNVSTLVRPPVPPPAPALVAAASLGNGMVRLTWKRLRGEPAGVKVEAAAQSGPFYEIADLRAGATSFVNTGLRLPGALRYRIRAYNRGGYSGYSTVAGVH